MHQANSAFVPVEQVTNELKKMTAFIRQEALEKAREIHLKADEEFAIEKSKLVRQETAAIDREYEKKFKTASMSQQITRSTMANKTRLRVLGARQSLLDELFEEARKKVAETSKNDKYPEILKGLILECMYLLNEKKVGVRCRKQDKDEVEKAAKEAAEEYKKNLDLEVETWIDEDNALPDDSYAYSTPQSSTIPIASHFLSDELTIFPFHSAGGVSIVGGNGKIELNNTFEERLRMCETDALPSVRVVLFGDNANRKFHD